MTDGAADHDEVPDGWVEWEEGQPDVGGEEEDGDPDECMCDGFCQADVH